MTNERTFADLVVEATAKGKPILLYFASRMGASRRLDFLFTRAEVLDVVAARYVFRIYERGRGVGTTVSTALGLNTLNPVLVVATPGGEIVVKDVVESYAAIEALQGPSFAAELARWANLAQRSSAEIAAAWSANPSNVGLAAQLAQRAWTKGEGLEARTLLTSIEQSDDNVPIGMRARAAWQRTQLEFAEEVASRARELAESYIARFPSHSMPAIRLLAASGAEQHRLDAAIRRLVDSTRHRGSRNGPNDGLSVLVDLNAIVYDALEMGVTDGALYAADIQVRDHPDNANAYDTLAQVYALREDYENAERAARRGLEEVMDDSPIARQLEKTIADASDQYVTIDYACRRSLMNRCLRFAGEGQLFPYEDPEREVERILTEAIQSAAQFCVKDSRSLNDIVVLVRIGDGGLITEILPLSEPSRLAVDCIRDRLADLQFETAFDGMEIVVRTTSILAEQVKR
jgi:hypothetical protein